MPTVQEVATEGYTIGVEVADRVPKALAILVLRLHYFLDRLSSSSNEVILINPLLVLTVIKEATKGYIVGVEVVDRIP